MRLLFMLSGDRISRERSMDKSTPESMPTRSPAKNRRAAKQSPQLDRTTPILALTKAWKATIFSFNRAGTRKRWPNNRQRTVLKGCKRVSSVHESSEFSYTHGERSRQLRSILWTEFIHPVSVRATPGPCLPKSVNPSTRLSLTSV